MASGLMASHPCSTGERLAFGLAHLACLHGLDCLNQDTFGWGLCTVCCGVCMLWPRACA